MHLSPIRLLLSALLLLLMASTAAADSFWPKVLTGEKGEIVIYQPQVESLEGQQIEARAAVMIKAKDSDGPVFGAFWFVARMATDQDTRMATLEAVEVTAAKFPDVEEAKVQELSRFLEQDIPTWDLTFSIDRIIADLAADEDITTGSDGYNNDPPIILVRDHPTVLVSIDGDPIFKDLEGPDLEYVVNSAFFMVREPGKTDVYLRGSGMWFTTSDIMGTWTVTQSLPDAVNEITPHLEAEEKEQAEEAAAAAEELELERADESSPPEIIVATEPTELIVTEGAADFASVEGTQLLYLKNTETDVIMDIDSQQYYVLLAGRWYRSKSFENGPWTYVEPDAVPADFATIPESSDMASVLPSVAGTQEAREAVLDTQIPQTAEIDRATATVTVTYDGDPQFESCAEGVAYALNTDKSVLLIDGTYYCCDSAVWFVSAGPEGPWAVATEVPAVIQELPPECPVYNVKYVTIYESTPEVVYVGYTTGYYNCYVYHGCVVYGTGWYYYPWYGYYYYPRPVTYGFGVHYNPWTGWGFSYGVSYGWITIGVSWGRYPYRGWGAAGYRYGYRRGYMRGYNHGYRRGYNHGARAGYRAGYRAGNNHASNNAYRKRNDGVRRTGDVGKQTRKQPATSDRKNDVYTDRNGNVYRDNGGNWEKREGDRWEADGDRAETREGDRQKDGEQRDRSGESGDRQKDGEQRDRSEGQRDQSTQQRDRSNDRDQSTQQRDRSNDRDQSTQQRDRSNDRSQQELNRDRSSRDRGSQRQQQRSAPRRGGGGGGRRR